MEVSLIVQQVLLFLPWKLDQTFLGVNSWVLAVIATFNFHWVLREVFFWIKFKYWIYDRSFNNKLIKCNLAWSLKESDRMEWLNWTELSSLNLEATLRGCLKNQFVVSSWHLQGQEAGLEAKSNHSWDFATSVDLLHGHKAFHFLLDFLFLPSLGLFSGTIVVQCLDWNVPGRR